jgi:hypothetical protein
VTRSFVVFAFSPFQNIKCTGTKAGTEFGSGKNLKSLAEKVNPVSPLPDGLRELK